MEPQRDELLTTAQLADRWQCSRQHIYRLMKAGLPSVKLGSARRIRASDAEAYLVSQADSM